MGSTLDGAQERVAKHVMATLEQWTWPTVPERPATLEASDAELVRSKDAKERGQKLKKDEQTALRTFGRWRAAVFHAEGQASSRLKVCLWVAEVLEGEQLDLMAMHLHENYGVSVPPMPPSGWERDRLVERQCTSVVMSPWMQSLSEPRDYVERQAAGAPVEKSAPEELPF